MYLGIPKSKYVMIERSLGLVYLRENIIGPKFWIVRTI